MARGVTSVGNPSQSVDVVERDVACHTSCCDGGILILLYREARPLVPVWKSVVGRVRIEEERLRAGRILLLSTAPSGIGNLLLCLAVLAIGQKHFFATSLSHFVRG